MVLEQTNIGNSSWTEIEHDVIEGSPKIASIVITVTGSDMLAVDDFTFNTTLTSDSNSADSDSADSDSGIGTLTCVLGYSLLLLFSIRKRITK